MTHSPVLGSRTRRGGSKPHRSASRPPAETKSPATNKSNGNANTKDDALPVKRAPQQQRALDRIEAILAAAEVVVAEGGYENLTMVNIAARAGITHSSIYHYFNSVEAILVRLISRVLANFSRDVSLIAARAESPEALVEAVVESIEYGFHIYRRTPVVRGLWAATRYLPALRKLDDEDTVGNARLFSERFAMLAPDCDRDLVSATMHMVSTLVVPAYEAALSVRKSSRNAAISSFLEMVRWRLRAIVLAPREHVASK